MRRTSPDETRKALVRLLSGESVTLSARADGKIELTQPLPVVPDRDAGQDPAAGEEPGPD
jgi:hypothetical protein